MNLSKIHRMDLNVWTDGGARGNPGPAGIGVVFRKGTRIVGRYKEFIGEATNNQAEYRAVLLALEHAQRLGATNLHFHLDSELVVSQLRREYRVKDKQLASLFVKIWNRTHLFKRVIFSWIPREENCDADRLVNEAIDGAI